MSSVGNELGLDGRLVDLVPSQYVDSLRFLKLQIVSPMKYPLISFFLVLPLILAPTAFADAKLDAHKAILEKTLAEIDATAKENVEKTNVAYLKMLLKLKQKVQQEGDLDKAKAVIAEVTRFEADAVAAPRESSLKDLAEVQRAYAAELAKVDRTKKASQRSLLKKYDIALEKLQKQRVQEGKIDAAQAVRAERERASSMSPSIPVAKLQKPTADLDKPRPAPQKKSIAEIIVGSIYGVNGSRKSWAVSFKPDGVAWEHYKGRQVGKVSWRVRDDVIYVDKIPAVPSWTKRFKLIDQNTLLGIGKDGREGMRLLKFERQ
jgi:hypothetical protein